MVFLAMASWLFACHHDSMSITFEAMEPGHRGRIIEFLSANSFPFHVRGNPSAAEAAKSVDQGRYWNNGSQGFWIIQHGGILGMVVLEDLDEDTPMFDLRLAQDFRGRGLGVPILKALCSKVFADFPGILRFEGQTREDNIAMRKTFLRAGFLKEAHYRMAWPTGDGRHLASVAYAILRQDWESGTTTRFDWEDLDL
ncbi:GNAT family N-acetyltransferase [Glutamicibacter sp. MCAF14]|uniref:GNAT family N-acetyltransferase n=1 Tax=Glutamicibacter sp. MCAF14 TaxID=3233043 RepID=UPI003F9026AC